MTKRAVARAVLALGLFLGLASLFFSSQLAETSTSKKADVATKARVQAIYGKLPLHFESNQGQSDEQVKFLSRGNGYTLFLTPTEAMLVLRQPHKNSLAPVSDSLASLPPGRGRTKEEGIEGLHPEPTDQVVLRMKLIGANPNPKIEGLDKLPGKVNYFIGNDPEKWHTNISAYRKVIYRDVYPSIDLVYYGNQRQLEYDFVVAPGVDPGVIRLSFDGLVEAWHAVPLHIDDNGDLILHTEVGKVRLLKPWIYQEINGTKQTISGHYCVALSPS